MIEVIIRLWNDYYWYIILWSIFIIFTLTLVSRQIKKVKEISSSQRKKEELEGYFVPYILIPNKFSNRWTIKLKEVVNETRKLNIKDFIATNSLCELTFTWILFPKKSKTGIDDSKAIFNENAKLEVEYWVNFKRFYELVDSRLEICSNVILDSFLNTVSTLKDIFNYLQKENFTKKEVYQAIMYLILQKRIIPHYDHLKQIKGENNIFFEI